MDGEGRPVTCAIDVMVKAAAKGKNFYDRLKANKSIVFTAMKEEDTLSCVTVSVQGKAMSPPWRWT